MIMTRGAQNGVELISIRGLKKSYKDVHALRGVNFSVRTGEVVGILGPNGAGKTTLLEILEGLLTFDEGEVSVLGVDVNKNPGGLRGCLNVTMQATALPPALTVGELASLYESIYGVAGGVIEILRKVGLEKKSKSRIGRLSGGEKQRLAVALALIGTAELMVLDEPTSQLDPHGRRMVWESIAADVRAGRRTVVITTHQMEEAAALCTRLIIVDSGQVIAEGAPG